MKPASPPVAHTKNLLPGAAAAVVGVHHQSVPRAAKRTTATTRTIRMKRAELSKSTSRLKLRPREMKTRQSPRQKRWTAKNKPSQRHANVAHRHHVAVVDAPRGTIEDNRRSLTC